MNENAIAALKTFVAATPALAPVFAEEKNYDLAVKVIIMTLNNSGVADNPDSQALKKAACGLAIYQVFYNEGFKTVDPNLVMQATDAVLAILNPTGE